LDEGSTEVRRVGWEADTHENVPDRLKPRIKLANNPIDIFISINQIWQKKTLRMGGSDG
jgi:hypothetical protein